MAGSSSSAAAGNNLHFPPQQVSVSMCSTLQPIVPARVDAPHIRVGHTPAMTCCCLPSTEMARMRSRSAAAVQIPAALPPAPSPAAFVCQLAIVPAKNANSCSMRRLYSSCPGPPSMQSRHTCRYGGSDMAVPCDVPRKLPGAGGQLQKPRTRPRWPIRVSLRRKMGQNTGPRHRRLALPA